MRKNKIILFLIVIFVSSGFFNIYCDDKIIPPNNSAVYVKYQSGWFISKDGDIEKPLKDIKEKKILTFGNKAIVVGNKKVKDKVYLCVQLPDKSKYWGPLDYFTTKFIVITNKDLQCFTQPDVSYAKKVKLQPGYFGYFVKEQNGFINVDFTMYAPKKKEDAPVWIGNVWIKSGYTDDIKVAEETSFLSRAYNSIYGKTYNKTDALKELKAGLEVSIGSDTVITPVLKDLVDQLSGDVKSTDANKNTSEKVNNNFYTPTNNIKLRESPSIDGNLIRIIQVGEKLKLVEKGSEDMINGVKGNWSKFETEKGESGWCFDAYVEPYKE